MDNYFNNQQLIATARADNPRAPDEERTIKNSITFETEQELRKYIKDNNIAKDIGDDMIEQFFDEGFYEVEV